MYLVVNTYVLTTFFVICQIVLVNDKFDKCSVKGDLPIKYKKQEEIYMFNSKTKHKDVPIDSFILFLY